MKGEGRKKKGCTRVWEKERKDKRKKEGGRGCRLLHVRDKKEGEKNVVKS
jgi:hypothetical protein